MMLLRFGVILGVFLFSIHSLFAQNQAKIDSLQKVLQTTGQDTHRVKALCALCLLLDSNPDSALLVGKEGLMLAQKLRDRNKEVKCLFNIGVRYSYNNSYSEGLTYYQLALKRLNPDDWLFRAKCCYFIGENYYNHGNYYQAYNYFSQAEKIQEKLANGQSLAEVYQKLGAVYVELGEYSLALDYYLKSKRLYEKFSNEKKTGEVLAELAALYYYQKDFDKVTRLATESIKINRRVDNLYYLALAESYIGNVYYKRSDLPTALKYFEAALAYFDKEKIENESGQMLYLIGKCYEKLEQFNQSLDYYQQAYDLFTDLDIKFGIVQCLNSIAEIDLILNSPQNALQNNQKAITLALQTGSKASITNSYRIQAKIDSVLGDFRTAFKHRQLAERYKDSLFNEDRSTELSKIETRYAIEKDLAHKANAQKALKKRLKANEQARNERQYLGVGLALLTLTVFVYAIRRRKQKTTYHKAIQTLTIATLLLSTEFILLFAERYIDAWSRNVPLYKLGYNLALALVLTPIFERVSRRFTDSYK